METVKTNKTWIRKDPLKGLTPFFHHVVQELNKPLPRKEKTIWLRNCREYMIYRVN